MDKRINIVTGHYGSGKTEFALNLAFLLKKSHDRVYIVDLDIVNPYFRTVDAKRELEAVGIEVIASEYAGTNVDIPALPPEIMRVFNDRSAAVVFDVGGDDAGAVALGGYKRYFENEPYEMLLVINTLRPMTAAADEIVKMLEDIEKASRLKVTGLVNNSNLAQLTTAGELIRGQAICEEASRLSAVEIKYVSGMREVISALPEDIKNKAFEIKRYLLLPESRVGGVV